MMLFTRVNNGRPVLEPVRSNAWESRVVLNPAADLVLVDDASQLPETWGLTPDQSDAIVRTGGAIPLLYRAQGAPAPGNDVAPSSLGLCLFTRDFDLVKRWNRPVVEPNAGFHNLGLEDPRATRIGGEWHVYYTGYSGDPRPDKSGERRVAICHATTPDFVSWTLNGPVSGSLNAVPNKNAALFLEPVSGRYLLLHRPMEGPGAMTICIASSQAPEGPWDDDGVLMRGRVRPECARSWVGAGGPPIPLGQGRFLMVYHRGSFDHSDRREYDLGVATLDLETDVVVVSRIEPVLKPSGELEQVGDPEVGVDNVVFSCANYVDGDTLVVPYAGADSRIFFAKASLSEVLAALATAK